jgi:CoA-transferase family III
MAGALDGIRVIDFGQYLAGPLAALLLADQLRCKRPLAGLASAKPL